MEINKIKIDILKNLISESIGQKVFLEELTDYFLNKIEKKEKSIVVVSGQKNTFKKISIRTLFSELKKHNIIENRLDEIDLGKYNFNFGFNAFLTDLYYKVSKNKSEAILFKNLEKSSEEIIEFLTKISMEKDIKLEKNYTIKNKFLTEATEKDSKLINKIRINTNHFIFIYNYKNIGEYKEVEKKLLTNKEKTIYTKELTEKEKNIVVGIRLNKEIEKINKEFSVQIIFGYKENSNKGENISVTDYIKKNFSKNGGFDIAEYISYRLIEPLKNLIIKEGIEKGTKILIYVDKGLIFCKIDEITYKLIKYSIPTLEEVKFKLDSMIGVKDLKEFLLNIENNMKVQKIREKLGLRNTKISLNMIFAGNAGTGKTNAARITYKYLNALGVLSKGVLVEVSKADFISENSNDTAKRTNEIINSALGGVLFIDEAYALCENEEDKVGREIIDCLIKEIEDNREDLVVILAGYEKDMEKFLSINQGLKSRFPNIVHFKDYTPTEMYEIALGIAKSKGYRIAKNVKKDLIDLFTRNQLTGKSDLGNARFVRNIIENAIIYSSRKYIDNSKSEIDLLEREDFNFKVSTKFNLEDKLKEIIGLEEVKNLLRSQYKLLVAQEKRKSVGVHTEIEQNLNMVFVGNPGTGKTSIAKLVAQMLNSMGLLKVGQMIETDRSSFVSNIPGETSKKTEEKFKEALGGVLFIDEAYTLANDSAGREAIETLLKLIEHYSKEVIVILSGYEKEMEDFFDVNIGLRSRFPLWTDFKDYNPNELLEMAIKLVESKGFRLSKNGNLALKKNFVEIYENSDSHSENGRMVRNYVENLIRIQSIRVAEEDISVYEMNLITAKDIEKLNTSNYDNEFDLEDKLKDIIGKEEAKEFLRNEYKLVKIKEKRRKYGLLTDINKYMNAIFTGEVGTGKRTVLNILSEIYYSVDIVKAKNVLEINKEDLICKINNNISIEDILNKHIGKIVYIDEAEFLLEDKYKKVIKELERFIDKNSNRIIIILLGKEEAMKKLVDNNQGINFRFPSRVNFADYKEEELYRMAINILERKKYIINEETKNILKDSIEEIYRSKSINIKNGLMINKYLDLIIREQSIRIYDLKINSKEDFNKIEREDIIKGKNKFFNQNIINNHFLDKFGKN